MLLTACGPAATPEVVEKIVQQTVIVEKPVQQTVVVEKQVTKEVVKEVTKEVVKTVVATPAAKMSDRQIWRLAAAPLAHMSPFMSQSSERGILTNIFMGPLSMDQYGNPMPWLCDKWEFNKDFTSISLHIDPKAVWRDGTKVTAAQMKATWEYGVSPANPRASQYAEPLDRVKGYADVFAGKAKTMEGLVVVDDATLRVDLIKADRLMPFYLTHPKLGVVKMEEVLKKPDGWWRDNPTPNGPYQIARWDDQAKLFEFTPNPKWWGADKPILQKIEWVGVDDQQVMELMWDNNEIATLEIPFGSGFDKYRQKYPDSLIDPDPKAQVRLGTIFFSFFPKNAPMDDIHVRRALAHSVDWDKVVKAAWGNEYQRAGVGLPPHIEGNLYKESPDTLYYKFDPEYAKKELAASKYGSADKLPKITILRWTTAEQVGKATQAMVEFWRDNLGIKNVEILGNDPPAGDWKSMIQLLRLSGAGAPDPARFLLENISSDGYICKDYTVGCAQDTEFSPKILQLLKDADNLERTNPDFLKKIKEAQLLWRDSYFRLELVLIGRYPKLQRPWFKGLNNNYYGGWYDLTKTYIMAHWARAVGP